MAKNIKKIKEKKNKSKNLKTVVKPTHKGKKDIEIHPNPVNLVKNFVLKLHDCCIEIGKS